MLASLLPSNVSRVLYLDSDVLVREDLSEIWNVDLENLALAAVPDAFVTDAKRCERLGYDASYGYFNGGVLLLNLDYWRTNNIEQKCVEYYQNNLDKIVYNDQDLLNGLLYDKKKLLDIKWNLQEGAYRRKVNIEQMNEEQLQAYAKLVMFPGILHYSARKPWEYHSMHPLSEWFFEMQDHTPWKSQHPLLNPWNRLHRFIHFLPYTLGLKQPKYVDMEILKQYYSKNTLQKEQ